MSPEKEQALRQTHVEVWRLPAAADGKSPQLLIQKLAHEQIDSLLIEGGSEVAWSFLRENLIDKILLVIAPKIVGGRAAPSPVGGLGVERLSDAIPLKDVTVSYLDGDILYEAYVDKESTSSP
jgi:diaminohydroxyphosphoribosylaminopyrimidine deaminase/5-amino-6-(5-phosphoribosylamino)uracil reductase